MGEMEVFHVGRTQKVKEGEEVCQTKISVSYLIVFYSSLFF